MESALAIVLLGMAVAACGPQVAVPGDGGGGGGGQGGHAATFTCDGVDLKPNPDRDDELVYACLGTPPGAEGCPAAGEEVLALLWDDLFEKGGYDYYCYYTWGPIDVPCGPDPTAEGQCCYYAHMRYGLVC